MNEETSSEPPTIAETASQVIENVKSGEFDVWIDKAIAFGLDVLAAALILIIGYLVAGWIRKLINRGMSRVKRLDPVLQPWPGAVVRAFLLVVVLIAVLGQFGIQTTSLVAILGAAGLAIGLALQGTLSNVASGVMLLIFRPFSVGDVVNLSGEILIVDEVGLFTVDAHLPDGPKVIIPNSQVWGSKIILLSQTHNDIRRINETYSISYSDDIDLALQTLRGIVEAEETVLKEPAPLVAVSALADSSVDILVWAYTKRTDWWPTKLRLLHKCKVALEAKGLTIPFPQTDVHLFPASGSSTS